MKKLSVVDVTQFIFRGNMKTKTPEKYEIGGFYQKQVDFEIKSSKVDEESNEFVFSGYASTFGNEDFGGDIVIEGAFAESIKELGGKVKALWQHDRHEPIGIFTNLKEDNIGLFVEGRLPLDDDFVSKRIVPQLKIGSIDSMSIGYRLEVFEVDNETGVWRLIKVSLKEISLVTFPMNDRAMITQLAKAEINHKWDRSHAEKEIENPSLKIAGNLIADKVGEEIMIIPRAVFSARIAMEKSEPTQSQKDQLDSVYNSLNMDSPFKEGAKLSIEELQNLSKSDRAWAIKNLKLSTNASNFLAELITEPTPGNDENSNVEKEEKEKKEKQTQKVLREIDELSNLLKSKQE